VASLLKVLVYMSLLDTHRGFSEDFLKPPYNEEYEELVSPLCAMDREILEQFYRETIRIVTIWMKIISNR